MSQKREAWVFEGRDERDALAVHDRAKATGLEVVWTCLPAMKTVLVLGDAEVFRRAFDEVLRIGAGPGRPIVRLERIQDAWPLASRASRRADTVVVVAPEDLDQRLEVGRADRYVVFAGPCGVESKAQLHQTAEAVRLAGAHGLRGGAFKPRTSPHSFQGLGREGLELLREARAIYRFPVVTEVLESRDVEAVGEVADVLQVGARNMQNFALLQEVGKRGKPVLLKRGPAATLAELLHAAEYVLAEGNPNVILCERGIRTFETAYRNTLDLNAVPWLRARTHLPILVDPSHGTGARDLVRPMALAGIAAGADGLLVEVHHDPASALSDGPQSLTPEQFVRLMVHVGAVAKALGRSPW